MRLKKPFLLFLIFLIFFSFLTCGIEEFFYLPQISAPNTESFDGVNITLPYLSASFYYATNYTIFYRIYLSDVVLFSINPSNYNTISTHLLNDWNHLIRFLDSTNTNVPSASDFTGRGYFELDYETNNPHPLTIIPGTTPSRNLVLSFLALSPAEILIDNTSKGTILRNKDIEPISPDRYFLSSFELLSNENAGSNSINKDIAPTSNTAGTVNCAYVSMYILTTGSNPTNFHGIFSKPQHLGIFLLQ